MAKTDTRKDVGTVGQPSAPLSGAETQAREVVQRTSTVRRRNIIIAATLGVVVIAVIVAVAVLMLGREEDSVSTSASAVQQPATAPVTAPVAPVASAPVAPVAAAPKAPSANVASPIATKGLTSGKYTFKQISESSSNVVVATVAILISAGRLEAEDGDWLLVGSLQNIPTGSFVNPGDAVPDINYKVVALLASPCFDGSCVGFDVVDFRVYKTPSGEWRAPSFATSERRTWDPHALKRYLSKANNEPARFLE